MMDKMTQAKATESSDEKCSVAENSVANSMAEAENAAKTSTEKYAIYYDYPNLSLIDSSIALLKMLDIDFVSDVDFEFYGGEWGSLVNERLFLLAQAYNIAKAASLGRNLLVLEDDAYCSINAAKAKIDESPSLYAMINAELNKFNLKYTPSTKVLHLGELLDSALLSRLQKSGFSDFSVSIFSRFNENLRQNTDGIYQILGFQKVAKCESLYFRFEDFNPNLAYKYSANDLQWAIDNGSDFIITTSMGVFDMFDKKRKNLNKATNRHLSEISVLFLPQVILLSLGVRDEAALAFRYHKFAPSFL